MASVAEDDVICSEAIEQCQIDLLQLLPGDLIANRVDFRAEGWRGFHPVDPRSMTVRSLFLWGEGAVVPAEAMA